MSAAMFANKPANYGSALYRERHAKVYDYADPYRSTAYGMDPTGHGWDRLACIAGEYARGEIDWRTARQWCNDNWRDLAALL